MKYMLLTLMFTSLSAFAADCTYSTGDSTVKWTAFKTPKKVGVDGQFTKTTLKTVESKDKLELIKKATFSIDTTSISTGNPARDKTIRDNFFTTNNKPMSIQGQVTKVTAESTTAVLNIDGTQKEVTFKNTINDDKIILQGTIDVLEFKLNSQFNALHNACKALHEGKTWTDVNISIETALKSQCK